jgi:hypothetical protein
VRPCNRELVDAVNKSMKHVADIPRILLRIKKVM